MAGKLTHAQRLFLKENPPGRPKPLKAGTGLWAFLRSIEEQDRTFRLKKLQSLLDQEF